MSLPLVSQAYLPPVEYFVLLHRNGGLAVEAFSNYCKQTYRNRCRIAGANEIQTLTIPVVKPQGGKCFDRDTRISYHLDWEHQHWNTLFSAYGSAPFFEFYADTLAPFYHKHYDFLFDYNMELMLALCDMLHIPNHNITTTETYEPEYPESLDFREVIHPKHNNIQLHMQPYYQVFASRHGWQPGLSIIDLIMNMGHEALLVLNDSNVTK